MATGTGGSPLYPPQIWRYTRQQVLAEQQQYAQAEADPRYVPTALLYMPCPVVEVYGPDGYVPSEAARLALAKDYRPGKENDRSSIGGRLRLTLPATADPGRLVIMGRARGLNEGLNAAGLYPAVSWLGLDAAPLKYGDPVKPKGWHPITFRLDVSDTVFELDTGKLKLSCLVVRARLAP